MKNLGIDISKDDFYCAFDSQKSSKFFNTKKWINNFIKEINKFKKDKKEINTLNHELDEEIKIWVESTWVYHLLFSQILTKAWFKVFVINPIITNRQIKASWLRNIKTDKTDAFAIRNSLMLWEWYLYTENEEELVLKSITRERAVFVKIKWELKQRLNVYNKKKEIVWEFLDSWIKSVIKTLESEIKKIDKKSSSFNSKTQNLLQSIPWIWPTCSSSLVAEIWDIGKFSNPNKLTAFLWMDCRIYESWISIKWKWFLTKKWNPHLRWLLFNAAFVAKRYNPTLKNYFDKKISEWKHFYSALCATERKLIHLIYAVWSRWSPYIEDYKN